MNVDELEGAELIKAFAEALGHTAKIFTEHDIPVVRIILGVNGEVEQTIWACELPAGLIIREFDRIKPKVIWVEPAPGKENGYFIIEKVAIHKHPPLYRGEGPDFKTAMARLVIKLAREKK